MIVYHSTRSATPTYIFSDVIKKGIADDGGLFVPQQIPAFQLSQLENLQDTSYAEQALFVLDLWLQGEQSRL